MKHDNQANILLGMTYNVLKAQEQQLYVIDIMAQPVSYNGETITVKELLRLIEEHMNNE